jgi:aspartyl protease family protein
MRLVAALTLALWTELVFSQSIYVTSVGRNDVQLIINGAAVRSLRPGETSPEGVKLLELRSGAALLEAGGRQMLLGLGQSTQAQTVLNADRAGHFPVNAYINGVPVAAIIDTGASGVALNMVQARQAGVDFSQARRGTTHTANGAAPVYFVTFARVQVGDIVLHNVPGSVIDGGPEKLGVALIGMSFLKHVEMRRAGTTMTLTRPHLQ